MLEISTLERTRAQTSVSIALVMALSFGIFSLILAAYIGLIPLGHWQDEFAVLPVYTVDGWNGLLSRLISWSPRPFSELLIFAYAHMVEHYHSSLIGSMLSALWLMLSISILAVPIIACQAFPSAMSRWQIILLSLGLYCLMLVGHPVSEFFYWPQGAAAYIPAIAGVCAAMWIIIVSGTNNMKARWAISVMLTVAALSAEVGAMLVTVFCLLLFFQVLMDKLGRKPTILTDRGVLWLTIPFVAAATVLIAVRFGRLESTGEIMGDSNIAHHLIPALSQAALTFLRELLFVDGVTMTPKSLALGLATKAFFFLAAYSILRSVVISRTAFHTDGRLLALLSLACFATVFLTIAAAFYQFGIVCCERHGTFRQLLILLGLISFSAFAAGWAKFSATDSARAPATTKSIMFLVASVLIPASISAPWIALEYRHYSTYLEVSVQNWNAGIAPGDRLVYRLLPPGKIIGSISIPDGNYTLTDDSKWIIHSMISYFHKKSITFETVTVKPMNKPPAALLAPLKQPAPQCFVDIVNDRPYQAVSLQRSKNGTLKLQGWTKPALSAESYSMSTWVVVSSQDGKKHYFETTVQERPDVAAVLKRPEMKDAGFIVTLDLNALPHKQTINLLSVSRGIRDISYDCGMAIEIN